MAPGGGRGLVRMLALAGAVGPLAACRAGVAEFRLAVGWAGALPAWQGPCDPSSLSPAGVVIQTAPGAYAAVRPGVVAVRCRKGRLRLRVGVATRLALGGDGPLVVGERRELRATLADDEGPLDLGDGPWTWTVTAPLRERERCHEGRCAPASSLPVSADGPGEASATVRAAGLVATRRIVVRARAPAAAR